MKLVVDYYKLLLTPIYSFDNYALIDYTQLLEHGINLWKGGEMEGIYFQ